MKCALCKINDPNKKNTHFLTDSIIRTCLNENGENIREKGFYFDISNNSAFVEFNFQRRTTIEKLTTTLGREPNEDEIEKARTIPFSVDNIFCSDCEKKFTAIEEKFTGKYLDVFRGSDNSANQSLSFADYKIIKSFFLLQVWRTSICDEIFKLSEEVSDKLRLIILNNDEIDASALTEFPLAVTYLITENRDGGYMSNFVGYTDDEKPNVIIMNDFIIQFFPDVNSVKYFDFYGLNDQANFQTFLNMEANEFSFKILNHDQRRKLLTDFITQDKIKDFKKFYAENFARLWFGLFGSYPSRYLVYQYLTHIVQGSDTNLLHYTDENIFKLTSQFIESRLRS